MSRPIPPYALTMQASLVGPVASPPPSSRATIRPASPSDAEALGRIYFESYEPGTASESVEEAIDDIRDSFRGSYGQLWTAASPVAVVNGEVAAAVLTVLRAPWSDVPDCPFVLEVFTAPSHRRKGLARTLLREAMGVVRSAGETTIALRVRSDNQPALDLYRSLGFVRSRHEDRPDRGADG